MPVSYTELPYNQLLCHQAAYDLIDANGREFFDGWDILKFEKEILTRESTGYIRSDKDRNALIGPLASLDSTMPFLKFGEPGKHYAYELFLSPPDHWWSRGAPLFWAYAARQFTYDILPMDEKTFSEKYKTIVATLGIPYGKDEYVYVKRFAAGGMSSGMVGGQFVEEALSKLQDRLKKY